MRSEAGTYLSITFPLVTGGEGQPRLIRAVPQRADTQRIVREREDFLFMLIEPRNPLSEGDFVPPYLSFVGRHFEKGKRGQ